MGEEYSTVARGRIYLTRGRRTRIIVLRFLQLITRCGRKHDAHPRRLPVASDRGSALRHNGAPVGALPAQRPTPPPPAPRGAPLAPFRVLVPHHDVQYPAPRGNDGARGGGRPHRDSRRSLGGAHGGDARARGAGALLRRRGRPRSRRERVQHRLRHAVHGVSRLQAAQGRSRPRRPALRDRRGGGRLRRDEYRGVSRRDRARAPADPPPSSRRNAALRPLRARRDDPRDGAAAPRRRRRGRGDPHRRSRAFLGKYHPELFEKGALTPR